MTEQEHNYWQSLKGATVSLCWDDETSSDGKLQGVIKGTHHARTHRASDAVIVQVVERTERVRLREIVRVHMEAK